MKTSTRLLSFALFAVLGSASAQTITSVTGNGNDPSMGSLGTTLDIVGTGFGGPTGLGKPKAFLLDPVTQKKFALKIITSSDTEITATITKAAYGALDVQVQPKGAALLTSAAAFTVPQPDITGISPVNETGTIGTTVTISGTGLLGVVGLSKPKVQLLNTGTNKKYALKVTAFSDTQVTANITKAVAGTLELQLLPKGGAAIVVSPSFTVPVPDIDTISPAFAFANQTVTLDGTNFGTGKPKVVVGGKSAKLLTFGDTQITFMMPNKLAKGVFTLLVTNKVGTFTQTGALIMQGQAADTDTTDIMSAKLGKASFATDPNGFFAVTSIFAAGPPAVTTSNGIIPGNFGVTPQTGVTLAIPFDTSTYTDPVAFVDAANGSIEYQISGLGLFDPPQAVWRASPGTAGSSYSIVILDVQPVLSDPGAVLMKGAFSGTLKLVEGTGADTLVVTNGEVRSTFQP